MSILRSNLSPVVLLAALIGTTPWGDIRGDDFFWSSPNGGLFSDPANWNPPGGPPQALLDTATIDLISGAAYIVELDNAVGIDSLTLNASDAELLFISMGSMSLTSAELLTGAVSGNAAFNFSGGGDVAIGAAAMLSGDFTMNFDGQAASTMNSGDNQLLLGRTLNVGKLSTLSIDANAFTNNGLIQVGNPFQTPGSGGSALTINNGPLSGKLLNNNQFTALNPLNGSGTELNFELENSAAGQVTFSAAPGRATLGVNLGEAHINNGQFIISRPTLIQGASLTNGGVIVLNGVQLDSTADINNNGTLNGTGSIAATNFINDGAVNETGAGPVDRLTFTGPVSGSGSFSGTVEFQARYAPGNSPAIVTAEDIILTSTSTLEMEVGGLAPGVEHDQIILSGVAELAGRLDVPRIFGYEPLAGDTVTILTTDGGATASIVGQFSSLSSPNPSESVAMRILQTPSDVTIQYVQPVSESYVSTATTADWEDPSIWLSGIAPRSDGDVQIANATGGDQVINVSSNSFANSINLAGFSATMTLAIQDGQRLSAINRVDIGAGSAIELAGGALVTSQTNGVTVAGGGDISGVGAVIGRLEVGVADGAEATFRPDEVTIDGDYRQNEGGKLEIEITSFENNLVDRVNITGAAELGGKLEIVVGDASTVIAGEVIEVITAGDIAPGEFFDEVSLVGVPADFFIAPLYNFQPNAINGQVAAIASLVGPPSNMYLGVYNEGDMNLDNTVDTADAIDFALALSNPNEYFFQHFIDGALTGDIDDDGDIDFDDIDDFAGKVGLSLAELQAIIDDYNRVPEPATFLLVAMVFAIGLLTPRWCGRQSAL